MDDPESPLGLMKHRNGTLRRARLGICAVLAALAALPAGAAHAAPPDNDAFADAQLVRVGDRVTGDTTEATAQAGEPTPNDPPYTRSVWYRLTPNATETLRIDTCGGGPWADLAIYTGTALGNLAEAPLTRSGCSSGSRVYIDAVATTTYYLRVAGYEAPPGYSQADGSLVLSVARPQAPANDNFENAQPVGRPAQITGSNVDATVQPGEPEPTIYGGSGHSVWYKLAATTNAGVRTSTTTGGDTNAPMLAVYTGSSVGALTEVGTEGGPTGPRTTMSFVTQPGTTYYIAVRGHGDGAGAFRLDVSSPDPGPPSPVPTAVPPAWPCNAGSDPSLIVYSGTHAAGGAVCLKVTNEGSGVAWFQGTNVPGDHCTIPWFAEVMYDHPSPIDNRRFSQGSPFVRLIGAFPTNRGARGTLQVTQRPATGPCHSAQIAWTATTTATPPWADLKPPALRLGGATVQRPLRGRRALTVRVRCRGEACAVSASATVAGVKVRAKKRTVRTSAKGRVVRLALGSRTRRALASALRKRGSVRTRVTVVARDAEGNRATARRTITLRR